MNEPFSIVPPPELVKQWVTEVWHEGTPARLSLSDMHIAGQAATWGADQELEACCQSMKSIPSPLGVPFGEMASNALRAARRPKPPSLKEQALDALREAESSGCLYVNGRSDTIRRALNELPDN